jgi:spectinomycin phosphotransferase
MTSTDTPMLSTVGQMDEASVRNWVGEEFGISLVSLDPIGHGADAAALLWRGNDATGRAYAVKLTGGGSPAGLVVPTALHRQGVHGVAAPLPSLDGRTWTEHDGRRLSLVPWVSDRRAVGGRMSETHWRAYGRLVADVHATDVSVLGDAVPVDDFTNQRLLDAIGQLHEGVDGSDPVGRAAAAEWRAAAPEVGVLEDFMTGLGQVLRQRDTRRVLCHSDPHLGNVLLGDDGVWLVDWDDAVLAPVERDLMFVLVGVLAEPVTDEQQARFFEGYGAVTIDEQLIAYYRSMRALEDFAYFLVEATDPGRSDEQRAEALRLAQGIRSPRGLMPLALSSLRALAA